MLLLTAILISHIIVFLLLAVSCTFYTAITPNNGTSGNMGLTIFSWLAFLYMLVICGLTALASLYIGSWAFVILVLGWLIALKWYTGY